MASTGAKAALFASGAVAGAVAMLAYAWWREADDDDDSDDEVDDEDTGEPLKMVLVVRSDLKMGKGKIAAQCCHAAVHCVEKAQVAAPALLESWERSNGTAKVCLKCDTDEQLLALAEAARAAGVNHSLISDAGRTQIAAGSRTVIGLGPAPVSKLDAITGSLKLL